jgi:hypothetical protein
MWEEFLNLLKKNDSFVVNPELPWARKRGFRVNSGGNAMFDL